jgi:hypothetical protein
MDTPPVPPTPAAHPAHPPHRGADAGLAALLDFTFRRFITLSIIKILYILGMALIGLGWLLALISSFTQGIGAALVVLIVGPVIALIYLIFFRIWLELIVVIFRIGENTSKLVQLQGGQPSTGASP